MLSWPIIPKIMLAYWAQAYLATCPTCVIKFSIALLQLAAEAI